MLREPEKYFDAHFTHQERERLQDKICDVAGVERRYYWISLERPTEDELRRICWRVPWCREEHMADYVVIKLARDLGIDHRNFAKNVPKLSIDAFVELAKKTLIDFTPGKNSTVRLIQHRRLHGLFCDWVEVSCPKFGCTHDIHAFCRDRFESPDYLSIAADIAAENRKRRKLVGKHIAMPTPAGSNRLRLVYSAD